MINETYTLSNGVKIPKLGLGTWFIDDDKAAQAVREAVKLGYRLIDTAQAYGNERGVGEGIRTCGVDRDQLFVTTKLAAEIKSYDEAVKAIDGSLKLMGLDYIDMIIIHSPQPWVNVNQSADRFFEGNLEAWRALEEAYKAGKLRAIGVSNYQPEHLRTIIEATGVTPAVNQVEINPYLTQEPLRALHAELGIVTEAWSPLGRRADLDDSVIVGIAERLGRTPAQVILRWHIQRGIIVFPKASSPERLRENADIFDFELSADDMTAIDGVDSGNRVGSNPETMNRR